MKFLWNFEPDAIVFHENVTVKGICDELFNAFTKLLSVCVRSYLDPFLVEQRIAVFQVRYMFFDHWLPFQKRKRKYVYLFSSDLFVEVNDSLTHLFVFNQKGTKFIQTRHLIREQNSGEDIYEFYQESINPRNLLFSGFIEQVELEQWQHFPHLRVVYFYLLRNNFYFRLVLVLGPANLEVSYLICFHLVIDISKLL